jgi:hypothetical protein
MSMTFWIHILNGRKIEENQNDLSALYKASESLDVLCEDLGVEKVSTFADYTDAQFNVAAEFGEAEEEERTDPETGWPYGIDDMTWHDVATGLKSFEAIQTRLKKDAGLPAPISKAKKRILEDLHACIAPMKKAPKGCKFHLAVVM